MSDKPLTDVTFASFDLHPALLAGLEAPAGVADTVVGGGFGAASYRLSLLALLGETNIGPELAPLAELPVTLEWRDELQTVGRGEVAQISAGRLLPQEKNP